MSTLILFILVVLWFLGYVGFPPFPFLGTVIFFLNGHPITLYDILVFAVILWLIGILPSPFKQIAIVFVILWVLSTVGIIAIAGLANLVVVAIILGLATYIFFGP